MNRKYNAEYPRCLAQKIALETFYLADGNKPRPFHISHTDEKARHPIMHAVIRNIAVFAAGLGAGGYLMAQVEAPPLSGAAESIRVVSTPFSSTAPATTADKVATAAGNDSRVFDEIISRLDAEQKARLQLEARLARLETALNALPQNMQATAVSAEEANPMSSLTPESDIDTPAPSTSPEQMLASLGVSPSVVQDIKRRTDKLDMERLALRDRAVREGWLGDQKYLEELAKVEADIQSLRSELGEDTYDKFLYSMGQPNRVAVVSVIEGSPAAIANVSPNDTIFAYAGNRIYTPDELRQATTEGVAGEMVPVMVWREGVAMELLVPRGPLGVKLDMRRERPQ